MNIKTNQTNEAARNALRNALIRKIDAALEAKEPDMDTVDFCTKLLDALERGSCQPRGRRMRQELARIAQEIDYIPQAHTMVQTKPMTVRKALVGVAAVFLCLLLLPITVILLRGGSQALSGQEATEPSTVASETAEPAITAGSVTFLRGDRVTQYDSLADCLDWEMPEIYYPTVFPDGVLPSSVTVTEEQDGICVNINFSDPQYAISIQPWSEEWMNVALEDGCQLLTMYDVTGIEAHSDFDAYQKYEDHDYYLAVPVRDDESWYCVYEFLATDAEAVSTMFQSMRRSDVDHVHVWVLSMVNVQQEDGTVKQQLLRSCTLCPSDDRPMEMTEAEKIDEMIAQKEVAIAVMEKEASAAQERMKLLIESLESAVSERDKTDIDKEISFMEGKLSEIEKKIQFLKDDVQSEIEKREYILSHYAENEIST